MVEKVNERNFFWNKILNILSSDCTQDCIDSKGTKIRLCKDEDHDYIVILDHISHSTIQQLISAGYLLDCDDEGHLRISSIKI